MTTEVAVMSNSTKPGESNKNGEERQTFDRAKFAAYKRDWYCGMTQDEAKASHGSSFDAVIWQSAAKTAEQERAKYSTPAPRKNDVDYHLSKQEEAAMEAARERSAVPHLRDMLKREYDEAQKRPRNEALEKWGPMIEDEILRDLERERWKSLTKHSVKSPAPDNQPRKDGPDLDRD